MTQRTRDARPRPRRLSRVITVGIAVFVSLCVATTPEATALDQVPAPPSVEVFDSPSGTYRFTLRAPDDWQKESPEGELLKTGVTGWERLWQRHLPQEYRARFAVVTDQGRVVMLDDWWNVHSRHAVVLVDQDGAGDAVWSFDQVLATLGAPASEVVAQAKLGPWISAPPRLDTDGVRVFVPTAGKQLVIDTVTGTLSVRP